MGSHRDLFWNLFPLFCTPHPFLVLPVCRTPLWCYLYTAPLYGVTCIPHLFLVLPVHRNPLWCYLYTATLSGVTCIPHPSLAAPLCGVIDSHWHSLLRHCFADHSQLWKPAPPQQPDELAQSRQQCTRDVKSWMTQEKLTVNGDKSEALFISVPRTPHSTPFLDSLLVGNWKVPCLSVGFLFHSAKHLRVTFNRHLTMVAKAVNLIRAAIFELRRINLIHHCLSAQTTNTLVSAFAPPRLDYAQGTC